MLSYIYESIEMKKDYTVKCFLAAIDRSDFHWHYEYELITVLKGSICIGARPEPVVLEAGDAILINTQEVKVAISCSVEELCWYNSEIDKMELEHRTYEIYTGPNSREEELLMGKVTL